MQTNNEFGSGDRNGAHAPVGQLARLGQNGAARARKQEERAKEGQGERE